MKKIILDSIASLIVIVAFIPMLVAAIIILIKELITQWVPSVFEGVYAYANKDS